MGASRITRSSFLLGLRCSKIVAKQFVVFVKIIARTDLVDDEIQFFQTLHGGCDASTSGHTAKGRDDFLSFIRQDEVDIEFGGVGMGCFGADADGLKFSK